MERTMFLSQVLEHLDFLPVESAEVLALILLDLVEGPGAEFTQDREGIIEALTKVKKESDELSERFSAVSRIAGNTLEHLLPREDTKLPRHSSKSSQ